MDIDVGCSFTHCLPDFCKVRAGRNALNVLSNYVGRRNRAGRCAGPPAICFSSLFPFLEFRLYTIHPIALIILLLTYVQTCGTLSCVTSNNFRL